MSPSTTTEPPVTGTPEGFSLVDTYGKLPARDIERARAFYARAFGLAPFGENAGHLYYAVGGTRFIVFPSSGTASGTHDQFGFVVDDLTATVATLHSRGVVLEDCAVPGATAGGVIQDRGHIRVVWLKDTEGNLISIAEFPFGSPANPAS